MNKPGFEPGIGEGLTVGQDADLIKETTTRDFVPDVVEASKQVPVLVDFWSERCEPCKQLTPILENAVKEAAGGIRLVKMDVDKHPSVASQMGIQSIPAVIVFSEGRPVDGFMGALPESEVKNFIKRFVDEDADIEAVLVTADEAFEEGDYQTALEVYDAVHGEAQDNINAIAGVAKCHVALGDLEKAKEALENVPSHKRDSAIIANVLANIELKEKSQGAGDLGPLQANVDDNPDDHQARFDLAVALNAQDSKAEAMEALLEIMKRKPGWNDNAARDQLIQFFDAWGADDPNTLEGRQKLSLLLFS